jgi:hypothetical protein
LRPTTAWHRIPPCVIVLLLLPPMVCAAPARFDFYDRGPYRQGIPRPADVLGYEPGTFHTSYGNMERYIDALTRTAADRIVREPFGRTYEFRERALLLVSSPANIKRLDAIREATAKLADPRTLSNAGEAERLIRETPRPCGSTTASTATSRPRSRP